MRSHGLNDKNKIVWEWKVNMRSVERTAPYQTNDTIVSYLKITFCVIVDSDKGSCLNIHCLIPICFISYPCFNYMNV